MSTHLFAKNLRKQNSLLHKNVHSFLPFGENDRIRAIQQKSDLQAFFSLYNIFSFRFLIKIDFLFDYFGKYEMEININFEGLLARK